MEATAASKSPTYLLAASKLGRDPIDWIAELRDEGLTWRAISLLLWSSHWLDVTEVTLRKWWADAQAAQLPRRPSP